MLSQSEQILEKLIKIDGVIESLVLGRDGFVIENVGNMDAEAVGAIIATAIGAVEAMGRDADQGGLFEFMAEFNDGVMLVAPLGRDNVLGIVAETGANLGRIRHNVKKNLRQLEQVL